MIYILNQIKYLNEIFHYCNYVSVNSSGNVKNTHNELGHTGSVIKESGSLLAKYGRREFTDKLILLTAFGLFLCCVIYIVQKRLF